MHARPVLAKELHVFRQGEQLQRVNLPIDILKHRDTGPFPIYIRALNDLQRKKGLAKKCSGTVYVSRRKLTPITVKMPGEDYLEAQLQERGVEVIWPETMSLKDQIDIYARAKKIIFAEGSSIHVRQFLGTLPSMSPFLCGEKGSSSGAITWKSGWTGWITSTRSRRTCSSRFQKTAPPCGTLVA